MLLYVSLEAGLGLETNFDGFDLGLEASGLGLEGA